MATTESLRSKSQNCLLVTFLWKYRSIFVCDLWVIKSYQTSLRVSEKGFQLPPSQILRKELLRLKKLSGNAFSRPLFVH